MDLREFRARAQAQLETAGEGMRQEIGAIMVKAAAEGSLHSGGTIKQFARAADGRARALTVALLNDYEAVKRRPIDRELLQAAADAANGFANTLEQRFPWDRINMPEAAYKPRDLLFAEIVTAVQEMLRRHSAGLPVDGVTKRDLGPGAALIPPFERWFKTNPALWAVIALLLATVAGLLVKIATG